MQGKMPRKKIHAKKKVKKKNHAEGRSNCDFYLIIKEYLPVSIENNSYSEYSWGLTPARPCYIISNK